MTTDRRAQLSEIMTLAWSLFRDGGSTFARALKAAWKITKRADAYAAKFMARARAAGGVLHLRSPIYSPTSRVLARGPFSRTRDWEAGRGISFVGR